MTRMHRGVIRPTGDDTGHFHAASDLAAIAGIPALGISGIADGGGYSDTGLHVRSPQFTVTEEVWVTIDLDWTSAVYDGDPGDDDNGSRIEAQICLIDENKDDAYEKRKVLRSSRNWTSTRAGTGGGHMTAVKKLQPGTYFVGGDFRSYGHADPGSHIIGGEEPDENLVITLRPQIHAELVPTYSSIASLPFITVYDESIGSTDVSVIWAELGGEMDYIEEGGAASHELESPNIFTVLFVAAHETLAIGKRFTEGAGPEAGYLIWQEAPPARKWQYVKPETKWTDANTREDLKPAPDEFS